MLPLFHLPRIAALPEGWSRMSPILVLALVVAVGAAAQGTTGVGFSLLVVPIAALVLPTPLVVGTVARIGLVVDVALLVRQGEHVDLADVLAYARPALVALPLAWLAGHLLGDRTLTLVAATGTLVAVALLVRAPAPEPGQRRVGSRAQAAAGFAAGFFGFTTGLSGPPVALHSAYHPRPGDGTPATLAAFFVAVDLAAVALHHRTVGPSPAAALVVAAVGGVLGGTHVARLVPARVLRGALIAVAAGGAVAAIVSLARGAS